MPLLRIIVASTSGHTDYVVNRVMETLGAGLAGWQVEKIRAEQSGPEDFAKGDALVLASSTWNTGGQEGQLNPHMYVLLLEKSKEVDLRGKKVACIALGDHRYFYTAGAAGFLEDFVKSRKGELLSPTLKIIDEPYGQEEAVKIWTKQLIAVLSGTDAGRKT